MQNSGTIVKPENRRQHPRFEERSCVMVTVLSAPDAPQIETCTYHCWTQDLSVGGMRFCVHSEVPVNAILKLEVTFADPRETFRHIGKVVWVKKSNDEGISSNWLGVQISETLDGEAQFGLWKICIENKSM